MILKDRNAPNGEALLCQQHWDQVAAVRFCELCGATNPGVWDPRQFGYGDRDVLLCGGCQDAIVLTAGDVNRHHRHNPLNANDLRRMTGDQHQAFAIVTGFFRRRSKGLPVSAILLEPTP